MSDPRVTPPEIVALIEKGSTEGLTDSEKRMLSGYAISARGQVDQALLTYIDFLTAKPSVDATGLSQPPSVAAQINTALESTQTPPTDPAAPYIPGQGDLRSQAGVETPLPSSTVDPYGIASNNNPGVSQVGGSNSDDAPTNLIIGNAVPGRGAGRDRTPQPGRTDWKAERDRIMGTPVGQPPEGSSFAGIDEGLLPGLAQNPELAARQIARSRGGGAASAAILAPQLAGAMGLNAAGVLAGGHRLGGTSGAGDQLALAEAFTNSMGPGSYVEPQPVYQRALKNAQNTPISEMFTGEGEPGDVTNQIQITNGALAAAAPYMTEGAANALAGQLQNAGDEYILGVANGEIDPNTMTYPLWLKTEKRAKKWVSRGLTADQIAAAF